MSYLTSITNNSSNSNAIQNALASLNSTYTSASIPITDNNYKLSPTFKMEMFKSENGGFVMNLFVAGSQGAKLFILNDIQNMGNDIQNILLAEILKS